MAKNKIFRKDLWQRAGLSATNLFLLKTEKVKAIRFSTLAVICKELDFQSGDFLEYVGEEESRDSDDKGDGGIYF
ncbi:MAG: helix-turn-helix domain-containing protein [Pseudomonadales bacterium]